MSSHETIRKCFADALRHGHDKMVAETVELFGFQEGDFTAGEHKSLLAFDPDPKVDVLLAAIERRLNQKRAKAAPSPSSS